jgi:hypothetical protein
MDEAKIGERLRLISEASYSDRDDLVRRFAEDLRESNPKLADNVRKWTQDGSILAGAYFSILELAHERADLGEGDKVEALDDARDFAALLQTFRGAAHGLVHRELAFRLAMNALFAGLRAGVTPEQIQKMHERWFATKQQLSGKRSGESRRRNRHWVTHAAKLAKEIRAKDPSSSQDDVASEITFGWKIREIKVPGHRQLVRLISELERSEELPTRTGSRLARAGSPRRHSGKS